ncbi:ABC transporter permease [Pediococcus stilesii]|uniref:ABC transporter permease n=1 Tax=Pediococcus stilesii TaxID=331679 RepID=A0A5R9BTK4_9LACO|nr:ABC transporter permease [Pediococcus stilesii]TLQ03929.1 ABC transporter permease [Pediococcus stilesii]
MNEIWNDRSKKYQKMILKYLRYVLNDHLVLALLFFVGGLGLAYSNWLKTLEPGLWYLKPLLFLVLGMLTMVGQPILLLEEPDKIFLMAQEKNIQVYLKRSIRRSLFSAMLPLLAGSVLIFPLLALEFHNLLVVGILIFSTLIGLFANILTDYQMLFYGKNLKLIKQVLVIALIGIGVAFSPILGVIGLIGIFIFNLSLLGKIFKQGSFYWNKAIKFESNRMNRLYHFFSLFTTVKNIQPRVKRRKYADGIINFLSSKNTTFTYLYSRIIIRSGSQGNLMLRLLLLGALIEGFSNEILLKVLIGAVTTYLIVIQMVDVYRPVHENIFVRIYPINIENQEKDLLSVMKRIILISAIFLTVIGLISNHSLEFILGSVMAQLAVAIVLLKWFVPRYIKKLK